MVVRPHSTAGVLSLLLILSFVFALTGLNAPRIFGQELQDAANGSVSTPDANNPIPATKPRTDTGQVSDDTPVEISRQVVLQPKTAGAKVFPDHRLNLGPVESGKKYTLKMQLVNNSAEPLVFRRVGANCSCVQLRVPKGDVPVGGQVDIEVVISVPERHATEVFLVGVDFFSDENGRDESPFFRVRVQSTEIQRLLCFGAIPSALQVGPGLKRLSLHLMVTKPLDANSLLIEKSETLQDAILSIAPDGKKWQLLLDISGVLLDDGFRDCWVRVRDPASERSAEARFMLEKAPAVSVSPAIMTFILDGESGLRKARAFLVLDESALEQIPGPIENADSNPQSTPTNIQPQLSIEAGISGQAIEVQATPLRRGLFRLELQFPAERMGDSVDGEISWSVECGAFNSRFHSLWRISE